jgi:hypothetical protein
MMGFEHSPGSEVELGKNCGAWPPMIEKTAYDLRCVDWQKGVGCTVWHASLFKCYDGRERRRHYDKCRSLVFRQSAVNRHQQRKAFAD